MEISGDGYQSHQIRRREEKEKEEHTEDEEEEEEEEEETRTMCCMQKKPYLTIVTLIAIAISLILCFDYALRDHLKNGFPTEWNYMLIRSKQRHTETAQADNHLPSYSRMSIGRKILRVDHRFSGSGGGLSMGVGSGGGGGGCTVADLAILQGETTPLPDGIPSFSVQVINLCGRAQGPCSAASDIHVSCGWFASAKLVNPHLFRRLRFNDCIVNDSKALRGGQSITFEYANSFQYPLAISSAKTGCH